MKHFLKGLLFIIMLPLLFTLSIIAMVQIIGGANEEDTWFDTFTEFADKWMS